MKSPYNASVLAIGLTKPTNRLMMMAMAFLLVFAPALVSAQDGFISDNGLGYTGGSLSVFGNLSDAQNNTNALSTNSFAQRDLALYSGQGAGFYDPSGDFHYQLTNWFSDGAGDGGIGNPNNTNRSFHQIYDTDGNSIADMSMTWLNGSRTVFSFSASGMNTITGCSTIPPQDCGRLWNGASAANGGSFLEWSINLVASGLTSAAFNAGSGFWESNSRPSSVSGSASGIFSDAVTGQYYRYEMDINNSSWAWDQGFVDPGTYAADSTVPEPATMTLLATGLAGMAAARKRRKKEK